MTVDTLEIDFPFGMPEEEPVGLAVLGECWNPIGFPNDFPDEIAGSHRPRVLGLRAKDCVEWKSAKLHCEGL